MRGLSGVELNCLDISIVGREVGGKLCKIKCSDWTPRPISSLTRTQGGENKIWAAAPNFGSIWVQGGLAGVNWSKSNPFLFLSLIWDPPLFLLLICWPTPPPSTDSTSFLSPIVEGWGGGYASVVVILLFSSNCSSCEEVDMLLVGRGTGEGGDKMRRSLSSDQEGDIGDGRKWL